jgi:hypothetical protein
MIFFSANLSNITLSSDFSKAQVTLITLSVQSRHLVDRIEDELIWLRSPDFADVFVRYEATACLETACIIVGFKEVAEMVAKLIVTIVVMPLDGPGFDCAVHAVNLPTCPRVCWLG